VVVKVETNTWTPVPNGKKIISQMENSRKKKLLSWSGCFYWQILRATVFMPIWSEF